MIFTLWRLRVFLLGLLFIIVGVFLWLKIVPDGEIVYRRVWPDYFKSGQGFIQSFTPAERVDLSGPRPKISGDPVYFSVFTPRPFSRAKLIITYQDHLTDETPVIEAGVLMDKLVWRYDLAPLQNKILDKLVSSDWAKVESEGLTLWQAARHYETIADFQEDLVGGKLANCPAGPQACLAVYNYSPDSLKSGATSSPRSLDREAGLSSRPDLLRAEAFVMSQPLRGPHQFYLNSPEPGLAIDIKLVDLNQDKAPDPVELNLYYYNQLVKNANLADPNLAPTSAQTEEKSISLLVPDLPSGIYKVEVKASQDIVIKEIRNSASQPSFINRLWPVSAAGPLTIFTDANYLQVKAFNPASLGPISFAGQEFLVDAAYDQFNFSSTASGANRQIKLEHDDLILENNGVFSWASTGLLNPAFKQVDRYLTTSSIQYILAAYRPPLVSGEFKVATAEFNLQAAYREKGRYSFLISIPGLRAESQSGAYLEIKEIRLELSGRTLWQKLFN